MYRLKYALVALIPQQTRGAHENSLFSSIVTFDKVDEKITTVNTESKTTMTRITTLESQGDHVQQGPPHVWKHSHRKARHALARLPAKNKLNGKRLEDGKLRP